MHQTAPASGFDPEDPSGLKAPRPMWIAANMRAYGTSKLANILSANKLDRQYGPDGIVFTSVHPGALRTAFAAGQKGITGLLVGVLQWILLYPQEMGALTQLYANTAHETAKKSGRYFIAWAREAEPMPIAHDKANQDACTSLYSPQSMPGSASRSPSTSHSVRRWAHRRHVAAVRAPSDCPRK